MPAGVSCKDVCHKRLCLEMLTLCILNSPPPLCVCRPMYGCVCVGVCVCVGGGGGARARACASGIRL